MSIFLSHREALDHARRAGLLVAKLHGPPDLVIGIRRSGLPVAMAFAQGAGAARTAFVTRRAGTRPGTLATLSRWGRQVVPRRLRQFGRSLLYRPVMALHMKLQRPHPGSGPFVEEQAQFREWLSGNGSVVVVDDAIDTGITMRRLVEAVQSVGLHHRIMTFALTSTLGLRVHEPQHHLFEDVVEYVEGDLGLLDEAATARVLGELEPAASSGVGTHRLEVRLQDLLTRPLHECVARALVHALEASGRRVAGLGLRIRCALWRLARSPDDYFMDDLRGRYDALPESARRAFGAALATELCAGLQPLARDALAHAKAPLTVRVAHGRWLAGPAGQALVGAEIVAAG